MAVLIGETISRFYDGELFKFERVAKGEWKQIKGSKCIPWCIMEEIEKLD